MNISPENKIELFEGKIDPERKDKHTYSATQKTRCAKTTTVIPGRQETRRRKEAKQKSKEYNSKKAEKQKSKTEDTNRDANKWRYTGKKGRYGEEKYTKSILASGAVSATS